MDPKILKKVVNQIHRRYPEFAGCQPKVHPQILPRDDAGEQQTNYLLTFSNKATAISSGGVKSMPRYLRVVIDANGRILKVTTSR